MQENYTRYFAFTIKCFEKQASGIAAVCTKEKSKEGKKKAFSVSCTRAFCNGSVQWKRKFVKSSIVVYAGKKLLQ